MSFHFRINLISKLDPDTYCVSPLVFRMVRELFVMAREHAPSIIFMDEIDSIGSSRGEGGSGGGDSEVQRTMLELLNQLDGFEGTKNIKVSLNLERTDQEFYRLLTKTPSTPGHYGDESNRHFR